VYIYIYIYIYEFAFKIGMLHSIYCLSCGSILNQVGGRLTIVPLGDRTEHDYVSGLLPSFFRLHLTVREFLSVDIITKGRSRLA
jgi:hypothetical protein